MSEPLALLSDLTVAAVLWLPLVAGLAWDLARRRTDPARARHLALWLVAATAAWLALVLGLAGLGAALGGRAGLVLGLAAATTLPFLALTHPRLRTLAAAGARSSPRT